MKVKLYGVCAGFDGETCKTHSRIGATASGELVMTLKMLKIKGMDSFMQPFVLKSVGDLAAFDCAERMEQDGFCTGGEGEVLANVSSALHRKSGKLIAIGDLYRAPVPPPQQLGTPERQCRL